jgi:hypothetical protein
MTHPDGIPIVRDPVTGKDRAEGFDLLDQAEPPDPEAAAKDYQQLGFGVLWALVLAHVVLIAAGQGEWLITVAGVVLVVTFYVGYYVGMVALGLGALYLLIRFVKWAWQR